MLMFSCFSAAGMKSKKNKDNKPVENADEYYEKLNTLQGILAKSTGTDKSRLRSFKHSRFTMKVMSHESPKEGEAALEKNLSKEKDSSKFSFQSLTLKSSEENYPRMIQKKESNNSLSNMSDSPFVKKTDRGEEEDVGYESDPGTGIQEFWASPKLVRSCSFVEAGDVLKKIAYKLPPSEDKSYEELHTLAEKMHKQVLHEGSQSPISVISNHSADRAMLKKHSTSQILPSQSRRLWWKVFLWSHRNMHKPLSAVSMTHSLPAALNEHSGHCSDTVKRNGGSELSILESPNSYTEPSICGGSGFWQENQWGVLSVHSPLPRVDDWVQEVANQPIFLANGNDDGNDCIIDYPPSPRTSRLPDRKIILPTRTAIPIVSEEIIHANSVIQSLNMSSTVAHITGVGLKVVPTLSQFSSLRSVNLSGNSIAYITPGSLPKGLQTLDLSRNKISAIEGFRELTRLRVLDLSYNKISRIGHGLSSCTLIKELFLAGNKISQVEGLHRLSKYAQQNMSFSST